MPQQQVFIPPDENVQENFRTADPTVEEIAAQLDVSVSTVESDFRKARAFLRSRLAEA